MRKISNPQSEIAMPGLEVFHDDFISSRKEEMIMLKRALEVKNFSVLVECSHKWRGFSAPYGFQELELNAILLENSALNSNLEECSKLLSEIEQYLGK